MHGVHMHSDWTMLWNQFKKGIYSFYAINQSTRPKKYKNKTRKCEHGEKKLNFFLLVYCYAVVELCSIEKQFEERKK